MHELLINNVSTLHKIQGGHRGFIKIPYILPYTSIKNTVQYRTFSEKKYRTYRTFSFTGTVHIVNSPFLVPYMQKKQTKKNYLYRTHTQILRTLKKKVPNVFKRQLRIFNFFCLKILMHF